VAKLPTDLSGVEVRAALERAGFVFRRQTGSHMILRRDQPYARAVVPDHKQILPHI
jgi:predicted RNA binding protein YcfA (HicA-like mRNA interferase family)